MKFFNIQHYRNKKQKIALLHLKLSGQWHQQNLGATFGLFILCGLPEICFFSTRLYKFLRLQKHTAGQFSSKFIPRWMQKKSFSCDIFLFIYFCTAKNCLFPFGFSVLKCSFFFIKLIFKVIQYWIWNKISSHDRKRFNLFSQHTYMLVFLSAPSFHGT